MVSHYELADSAHELSYADQRHQDALEEGSGFSPRLAEVVITGYDPDRQPPQPLRDRPELPRQFSRRGGRAYPEASDSELDPNWPVTAADLTPEARESLVVNGERLREVLRAREDAKLAASGADPQYLSLVAALRRARDDKRSR